MIEGVRQAFFSSSIPNLHALVVHFPVALLPVALLLDLGCLVARARVWLDRCASTLYVIGTAAAALAYLTGRAAAQAAAGLPGEAGAVLADHADLGLLTLVAYTIVTVLRVIVTRLGRDDKRITLGFFRLLALVASAAALVLLVQTADRGGALVYQHGVGRTTVTNVGDRLPADQI
jgi:uncharacterized membrane protein